MSEFLRVAFDVPLDRLFTYRNLATKAAPAGARTGCRVEAPFRNRVIEGWVVEELDGCDIDETLVKPIARIVDPEPLVGPATLALASRVARMYFCTLGETLSAMTPSGRRESSAGAEVFEESPPCDHSLELSAPQRAALDRILAEGSGRKYLFGATGSGKTEVFLQAAEATLAEGRGVIYLVPEIALTHQVVEAVRTRFGERCAVLHSGLTPSRRLAEWRRVMRGEADVVVGARSAIFAPVPRLGLVVVDEEHEGSYKSGSTPRYHARQVAMTRCAEEGARLVMGSATPSVEAWKLMLDGGMEKLELGGRLSGGAPPSVEIVDMRDEAGPVSARLAALVREAKNAGGQSILFLNRRGFSHRFSCRTCGEELACRHCSVPLTWHKDRDALVCHYCGYRAKPPRACPSCGSLDVGWGGFGTERLEEEVVAAFPDLTVRRLDADSATAKGEARKLLEEFRAGKVDVLLGTQMVAKGLNFPGVKVVGVVLADTSLNLPDFRAAERAFSLIVQVAGRAGRFTPDGRVVVQTLRPSSPVIRMAAAADVAGFQAAELRARRELGFPPYSRLVRVVFRSKSAEKADRAAEAFARLAAERLGPDDEALGPAECPIALMAGNARRHVVLKGPAMGPLHAACAAALAALGELPGVHAEPDPDPVSLL
ncbi:MAG: primosomal protein N' [Spirochaetia bacterium]|nr:primosomal protein N' [Spirochaetia bacterium]